MHSAFFKVNLPVITLPWISCTAPSALIVNEYEFEIWFCFSSLNHPHEFWTLLKIRPASPFVCKPFDDFETIDLCPGFDGVFLLLNAAILHVSRAADIPNGYSHSNLQIVKTQFCSRLHQQALESSRILRTGL